MRTKKIIAVGAGNTIDELYPIIKNSSVRARLWNLRKDDLVKSESKRLLGIHVRKKNTKKQKLS